MYVRILPLTRNSHFPRLCLWSFPATGPNSTGVPFSQGPNGAGGRTQALTVRIVSSPPAPPDSAGCP